MTPTELKAEAFDHIARVADKQIPALKRLGKIFDIIAKLERDEKKFWRRMAKLDRDIVTGKNRSFQLTREWTNFRFDGEPDRVPERCVEFWDPDTQAWERPLPKSQPVGE